jgi:hypothetical protein
VTQASTCSFKWCSGFRNSTRQQHSQIFRGCIFLLIIFWNVICLSKFRSEPCGRLRKASVTIVVSNVIAYNCLFVATVVVAYTLLSYRVWTATCSELMSVCYIDQRQIHPSNSLESLVCVW